MPILKKWGQKLFKNSFSHKENHLLEGRCMKSMLYPCLSEKRRNSWRKILLPAAGDTSPDQAVQGTEMLVYTSTTSVVLCQWESFGGCHTPERAQEFVFWCRGPVAASHILPPSEKAQQKKPRTFPLIARSRWAFSKTDNWNSQRNNLNLSESSPENFRTWPPLYAGKGDNDIFLAKVFP